MQEQAVLEAEQGQGGWFGWLPGWLSHQQHQVEGIEVCGQGRLRREPLHPFRRMPQPFAEPAGIGRLQPRGPQERAHGCGAALVGVGEHGQGGGALLQGCRQGCAVSAMEADPAGVLPGAADAGKGQLHRRGRRLEDQGSGAKALQQQAADAEPEGIAACQNHRPLTHRSGRFDLVERRFWLVRGHQGGAGLADWHPPCGLFQLPPGGQLSQQPFRRRHQVGLGQQDQGRRRQGRQPARIGADHRNC